MMVQFSKILLDHGSSAALLQAMIFIFLSTISSSTRLDQTPCFESIISFGDSLADTGNLPLLSPPNMLPNSARPPYGRTFFHQPTGRYSDGRLIIDFIAETLGLPLVQPYVAIRNANFSRKTYKNRVNFAVAGATALSVQFFEERLIINPLTNVSLGVELDWFNQFLASIPDGRDFLEKSLVLVGSIGSNDYNFPFIQYRSRLEVQTFVPIVVNYIGSAIRSLIKLGARTMLVPGLLPNGCTPIYLTLYMSLYASDYDPETGCLIWFNDFAQYHNQLLQEELSLIRDLYPGITISYADYYNDALRFYYSPQEFGFTDLYRSCCGIGGPYNFNLLLMCGLPLVPSCDEPSRFVSWDGIHLTEAAYKFMAQGLLEGPYTKPPIKFMRDLASQSK